MTTETFNKYLGHAQRIVDLDDASAVLNWDMETYMPHGAIEVRGEQLATLGAIGHQLATSAEYGEMLKALSEVTNGELEAWQKAAVKQSLRDYEKNTKLPEEHVKALARATTKGHDTWMRAREAKDFSIFAPTLTELVELKRKEAEYYGYTENPYDALIDLFEPGMTVAQLRPVFDRLREGTTRLLQLIADAPNKPDDSVLFSGFETDKQLSFAKEIVGKLGFDFSIGRVDLSAHPFCTSFTQDDVRLTTRIFHDDLRSCLFGLIHEAGHGMYEQGFDPKIKRTSLADGVSMGIHESQSLFWENMIARSESFWVWAFPQLQAAFPAQLSGMTANGFFRVINTMQPSFIRVEADELTYNLHIILRFEIEEALINGRMEVKDIPEVWNTKMREYLGLNPSDDAEGCLQDVHWSFAGFGYFPSYTLGKLYAAMWYNRLSNDMPDLQDKISRGEFAPIREWLREQIHQWGKAKSAGELAQDISGKPLTETDFLEHVETRIRNVYYS